MKNKIKNALIPLFLMFLTNLGFYYLTNGHNFGGDITPHLGMLFISGLFFGPYGITGAVIANLICDIIRGYYLPTTFLSAIFSFAIAYLAYKLWYARDFELYPVTKPRLTNLTNMIYLIIIVLICSVLYSIVIDNMLEIFYSNILNDNYISMRYFVNFMNFSLLFSLILMIISRYKDFSYMPEISDKQYNIKRYKLLLALIIITISIILIFDSIKQDTKPIIEITILLILLFLYNRKPITKIRKINYISIPEKIMIGFIILSFIIVIIDRLILLTPLPDMIYNLIYNISKNQRDLLLLQVLDLGVFAFTVPSLILLGYIERKLIKPLMSFSKIDGFINENEKIESEGILHVYEDYLDNDDEIGILSRSYTHLIKNNNNYIENMKKMESEKERIKTELNIAHKIQKSTLPKKSINNNAITIEGFCKPAKEVGGDFYDFYELDEDNTMIIIGDASGKGVPAAIFTIIIQNSIKLLMKNELNPAKVLYDVNNQICENNPEMMFITLFLGIYNKKTHNLTYANAGHNPPIITNDDEYKFLDIDSEIVLGVLEDYEFENQEIKLEKEIILYTDGITDAQNKDNELYGETRLLNFLNNQQSNENILTKLIENINEFSKEEEQFDDMTLLILTLK